MSIAPAARLVSTMFEGQCDGVLARSDQGSALWKACSTSAAVRASKVGVAEKYSARSRLPQGAHAIRQMIGEFQRYKTAPPTVYRGSDFTRAAV